jgi:prepilin-type N-terminal cleavage/methylation domain-containing protein
MRKQSGFTLMEMMVVIAIIAIVSAFTVPNMIAWRNNAQLSAGVRQIYSDLQGARKLAIKSNSMTFVIFDVGADTYSVAGRVRTLPPGLIIDSAVFTAAGDNIASFNGQGFDRDFLDANNSGAVTISWNGSRFRTIAVSSGGSIRIQ